MIKALGLHNDNSGCDYHRIRLPFQYGTDRVDDSGFRSGDLGATLENAEVITWNRIFPFGLHTALNLRKATGVKLVVDLDDYWHLYHKHYLFQSYQANKVPEQLLSIIRMADAVTVTTGRLASKVKEVNKNVHVIPNALPYGHGQFDDKPERKDHVFRILYACQRSHLNDISILKRPIIRISGDRRQDIGFTLAGYSERKEDNSGIWPAMEKIYTATGTVPNYRRINQLPLDEYMSIYDQADVVLVPLEENTFNSFKSNLKLLEAAAKKLPAICQQVPPYSDCDAPVLWVVKQTDWYNHIRYLSKNREAAKDWGERLHEWALTNHSLFAWNRYRFDLYEHIVNS